MKNFLKVASLCSVATIALSSCGGAKDPNVIVILIDDVGYGDMSGHGNPYINTPEMDRLAADGVEFSDFHVDPTSSPTRAALMTGRYSTRVGVWLTYASRDHLRREESTMANFFKDGGYRTAVFGKWHLGDCYPFRPMDRGFDESLIIGGGVVGEASDYWNNYNYDDTFIRNGEFEKQSGYCNDVWFDAATEFIDRDDSRPFFIYLPTNVAHAPRVVTKEYAAPYDNKPRAEFYGMINAVDVRLGELRRHLEQKSLADNTIIILMTDNGTAGGAAFEIDGVSDVNGWEVSGYNAALRGRKSSHYEGGHRATAIFYWKDGELTGGRTSDALTAHIDVLPTLLDLCGIENKRGVEFDGTSIRTALMGDDAPLDGRTLCVHHQGRFLQGVGMGYLFPDFNYAVMRDKWRLVGDELYDLTTDPSQKVDVAAHHPELAKELRGEYEQWFASISVGSERVEPFVIDPEKQYEMLISSQNLLIGNVRYNQRSVRTAEIAEGWTMINVEKPGIYDIEIRRWPKEADGTMCGIVSPAVISDEICNAASYRKKMSDIRPMNIVSVRVAIDDKGVEKRVNPADKGVIFEIPLQGGEHKIETTYILADGSEQAAYYTYITPSK